MRISINLIEKENVYIANCPELDINCYGENKRQAVRRIQQVIEFYIQSAKDLGLDVEEFNEVSVEGRKINTDSNSALTPASDAIN